MSRISMFMVCSCHDDNTSISSFVMIFSPRFLSSIKSPLASDFCSKSMTKSLQPSDFENILLKFSSSRVSNFTTNCFWRLARHSATAYFKGFFKWIYPGYLEACLVKGSQSININLLWYLYSIFWSSSSILSLNLLSSYPTPALGLKSETNWARS